MGGVAPAGVSSERPDSMLRRSTLVAPPRPAPAARPRPVAPARRGAPARSWAARHWWALALLAGLTWLLLYPYSRRPWGGLASWGDPMLQYWSMAWPVQLLRDDPLHLVGRLFDAKPS